MRQVKVLLDNIDKINSFVGIMEKSDVQADLCQGTIYIDAKSLMGILALAPKSAVALNINADDALADQVIERIQEYIA